MKQNCPKCNTNLVYYDLENRLQQDHEQAIKEQAAVDRVLNNIKVSAFGGTSQIIRFVLLFSPLLWMCLPMYSYLNPETMESINISLITLIKSIIATATGSDNGAMPFDMWLSEKAYLFTLITIACIIVLSLIEIISSLFSVGKNALKRNLIIHSINLIISLGMSLVPIADVFSSSIGLIFIWITYTSMIRLHIDIDKKLNK